MQFDFAVEKINGEYFGYDKEYFLLYIHSTMAWLNDKLKCKGYIFVKDVIEYFDVKVTKRNQVTYGWNNKTKPIEYEILIKNDLIAVNLLNAENILDDFD